MSTTICCGVCCGRTSAALLWDCDGGDAIGEWPDAIGERVVPTASPWWNMFGCIILGVGELKDLLWTGSGSNFGSFNITSGISTQFPFSTHRHGVVPQAAHVARPFDSRIECFFSPRLDWSTSAELLRESGFPVGGARGMRQLPLLSRDSAWFFDDRRLFGSGGRRDSASLILSDCRSTPPPR